MTSSLGYFGDGSLPDRVASSLARTERNRGAARENHLSPELTYGRHLGPPSHNVREAAVVVLLYPHERRWSVPLMKRPAGTDPHAGQVCLPGGVIESGESIQAGALRELQEEFGVSASDVRVLGQLSPVYVFVSNFRVTPFVASVAKRPRFSLNQCEVAELLEVPLSHLLDRKNRGCREIHRRGLVFQAPYIGWQEHEIWGATLSMLGELFGMIESLDTPS